MLNENQHPANKSIMVSILGRPNVGKSSLVNYLLGFDLSIVTHKPQTTRNQFHCSFTVDRTEIVLVDTPGVHFSSLDINQRMNEQAKKGADGADINLLVLDLSAPIKDEFSKFTENFKANLERTWIVFNKLDLVPAPPGTLANIFEEIQKILPSAEKYFSISAKNGEGVHELIGAICDAAPMGSHLYPNGDVSNKPERFFVAEYIREQIFLFLGEELPYETAVTIDDFFDRRDRPVPGKDVNVNITATIHVNRPSQRAIVIGAKGQMIRDIGQNARVKIEAMLGTKIFLNLHVKVSPRWYKNHFILEEVGLPRPQEAMRAWRQK